MIRKESVVLSKGQVEMALAFGKLSSNPRVSDAPRREAGCSFQSADGFELHPVQHFDADLTTSKCRRAGSGAVQFQAPAVEVWMTAFKACSSVASRPVIAQEFQQRHPRLDARVDSVEPTVLVHQNQMPKKKHLPWGSSAEAHFHSS